MQEFLLSSLHRVGRGLDEEDGLELSDERSEGPTSLGFAQLSSSDLHSNTTPGQERWGNPMLI
jgi:hypothetical protein